MKNGEYELVIAPDEYSGKRYRDRYCYEHHLVWWQASKELPKTGEVIHHINEDKRDNRIENLELQTKVAHSAEHGKRQIRHRTLAGYRRGCRCDRCRDKNTRYLREYRRRIVLG